MAVLGSTSFSRVVEFTREETDFYALESIK